MPESVKLHGQQVYIATGQEADPDRVQHFQRQGYRA
jgi:hypothetical protein